jgi:hypothetical protein
MNHPPPPVLCRGPAGVGRKRYGGRHRGRLLNLENHCVTSPTIARLEVGATLARILTTIV